MINNQLLEYIRRELALNVSKEVISANLKSQGWTDEDVREAYAFIANQAVPLAPTAAPFGSSSIIQPQPQQQAEQVSDAQNVSAVKSSVASFFHKYKTTLSIIVVILFLAIAGGGAYGYYSGMFVSLPGLTSQAIDNIKNVKSATYDTTINVDVSGIKDFSNSLSQLIPGSILPTTFSLTSKGAYDFIDTNNGKISSLISIDAGMFSTAVDLRMLDNNLYGEIVKAPSISFASMLTEYENKWFSFPFKSGDTQSLSGVVNPVAGIFGIDPSITDSITPAQKEQLYQITRNAHFVKMVQRFSPDTISGQSSYHFLFDLDREGIVAYFQSLKDYINTVGKNDSKLSSFDPTSFSDALNKIEDFKGEIWIGRKDTLPYKLLISFAVKPDESKDEKVKINAVSIFGSWNQPVSILAPIGSTPFMDFMNNQMKQSQSKVETKTKNNVKLK